MCRRGQAAPISHRTRPHQEGSLIEVTFVGSFPTADFRTPTPLPEVAFVGRSNVGKSSLINAVTGRKAIARISKHPGKTRDCNVYLLDSRLYLIDLPGYGYAKVSHGERRRFRSLVENYLATRSALAGVVWLLDVRRDPSPEDLDLGEQLMEHGTPVLVAITKADKMSPTHRVRRLKDIATAIGLSEEQAILTSTTKKIGIADLRNTMMSLASPTTPEAL